jgi:hypothetical protein
MQDGAQVHDAIGVPEEAVLDAVDRFAADAPHQLGLGDAADECHPVAELHQFGRQIADRRLRTAERPLERRVRVVAGPGGGIDEHDVHAPAL